MEQLSFYLPIVILPPRHVKNMNLMITLPRSRGNGGQSKGRVDWIHNRCLGTAVTSLIRGIDQQYLGHR